MLADWALLMGQRSYIGNGFTRLKLGPGIPILPSHLGGGPWFKSVHRSNRLSARMVRGLTGHAPIASYAARFHNESARCMCGSPFEDVGHILHLCPLWKRNRVPSACLHLAVFVRFLKANPRAFEFPGVNLEQESGARNPGGAVDKPG